MNWTYKYNKGIKGIFLLYGFRLSRKVISYIQRPYKKHTWLFENHCPFLLLINNFAKKTVGSH